jgi:hypothetical protein
VWLLEIPLANRKASTLADAYGLGAFAVHLTFVGRKIGTSAKQQSFLGIFVVTNYCRLA